MAVEILARALPADEALHALNEAQVMSESALVLVEQLIDEVHGELRLHAKLQAVRACLLQLDAAVDPALERLEALVGEAAPA